MKAEYIYDDHTRQLLEFNEREKAIKDRAIPKIILTPETQEEKAQIEELLKANINVI